MSKVTRWHYYTDGTHQANATSDAWAMVATAEDDEGFAFYGFMAASTTEATRDGTNTATSTTSELAALIWTYAYIYALHCESPTDLRLLYIRTH